MEKDNIQSFLVFLNQKGYEARLVGGAVRDLFLGLNPKDVDVVYVSNNRPLPEDLVISFNATYKAFKINWQGILISLSARRKDVVCHGRHAAVDFNASWQDDARRRDFTMNALYQDEYGTIFDPLGMGLLDLIQGKIRFIGNPSVRIVEDYLRLWRYYRFCGFYSQEKDLISYDFDQNKHHSPERVRGEFFQILISPRVDDVLPLMVPLLIHHFGSPPVTLDIKNHAGPLERLYALYPNLDCLSLKFALRRQEIRFLKKLEFSSRS